MVTWQSIGARLWFLPRLTMAIAIGALLSGCRPTTSNRDPSADTLKLLYWQAPTILNPHLSAGTKDWEASRITLEPLASFDKAGKLVPILATELPSLENGDVSPDGRSVTWKLKSDLQWSDGTPFTAADVVFTYEFVSNPQVGAITLGTYEQVAKVEALDDLTVKIHFKDVTPGWSLPFVGPEGCILPRHRLAAYTGKNAREAPTNLTPVGTGPYRVVEFKPGDVVVYEANPYFREADQLGFERVELKGGGDATSAARAVLQTGDADYAHNLQVEAKVLKALAGAGQVVSIFGGSMERILINHSDPNRSTPDGERSSIQFPHPFFSDALVRQAFALTINRGAIAEQLYGPTGKATANFLIAPESLVSPNTRYTFDLEQAARLLDQAGWQDSNGNGIRDKNGVEMQVLFQTSVNPLRQKTQEIIKQAWRSLGIGVEIKSIDATIFFSSDPASNDTVEHFYADLQMFTRELTSPDPSSYMKTYTCDEIPQKANNWSGNNAARYCNEQYDALWQQSTQTLDPQKRRALFIQMNDLLVNEAAVIPLIHRAEVIGVSNQLQGVDLTPWDVRVWNIKDWHR